MDGGVYNRDAGASGASGKQAGASGSTGEAGKAGASGTMAGGSSGRAGASGASAGQGGQPTVDAAVPPSCAGELVFNICWYLGAERQNCKNLCAAHGGFDTQSITHIGTPAQGGSRDDCQRILNALGRPATVVASTRSDGNGLGCHVWQNADNYWLNSPNFDPNIQLPSNAPVRMACGCER